MQSLPALRRLCVLRSSLCLLQSLLDGGLQLLLHLLLHLRVCRCRWQVCRRRQLARASAARQHDVRCLHGAGRRSVPVDIRPHRLVDEIERFIQVVHGLLLACNVVAVDAFAQALRLLHDELCPLCLRFRRHIFRSGRHCTVSLLNGLVCLVHLCLLLLCRLVAADGTVEHRERKRRHEVCGDLFFRRLFIRRKIADCLVHTRVRHAACRLPQKLHERRHHMCVAQHVGKACSHQAACQVASHALCAADGNAFEVIFRAHVAHGGCTCIVYGISSGEAQRSRRHLEAEAAGVHSCCRKPGARRFSDAGHQCQASRDLRAACEHRMLRLRPLCIFHLPVILVLVRAEQLSDCSRSRCHTQPLLQPARNRRLPGVQSRVKNIVNLLPLLCRLCVTLAHRFLVRCKGCHILLIA